MAEEEVTGEVVEEEGGEGSEEVEYLAEDIEVEDLSISEVEIFLSRAELWDNLLQNKISISEARDMMVSLEQIQQRMPKALQRRTRRRKS